MQKRLKCGKKSQTLLMQGQVDKKDRLSKSSKSGGKPVLRQSWRLRLIKRASIRQEGSSFAGAKRSYTNKSWNFTPRHQTLWESTTGQTLVSLHLYFRILPLHVSQPIKSSHMVSKVIIIKTHNTKRVL